jgi:pimeloyl-ACP methyl ester carboxylesterase
MGRLLVALCLAALPLSLSQGARAQAPSRPAQQFAALATSDGVRATLYRYVPAAGASDRTLLLLPDVGMTRHAFDFDGRGLAPHLQRAGWEVYVVEWRGSGRSEVPFGGYRLEDLLDSDAEAAFARATVERRRIAVGGVGLGATIALALAARHPEQVSQVVALQPFVSPDVPSEPVREMLAHVESLPPWLDLGVVTREPLFGARSWFEILFANDGSLDGARFASLRLHVLAPVPRAAALQVARSLRERRLELGGKDVRDIVRGWGGPTLLVIAPRDNWIHPEFAVPVRDLLGRERCRLMVLGALSGCRHDYGHLGMLLGDDAGRDVFSRVARFLDEGST